MSHEVSVNGVCPKRILRTYVSFRLLTQGRDSKVEELSLSTSRRTIAGMAYLKSLF